jgi:hypothetical protein
MVVPVQNPLHRLGSSTVYVQMVGPETNVNMVRLTSLSKCKTTQVSIKICHTFIGLVYQNYLRQRSTIYTINTYQFTLYFIQFQM